MKIIIDPGHGGVWRPTPPSGDPGVVTPDGKKIESYYTWIYANTLQEVLIKAGFTVILTRDNDDYTVPSSVRTSKGSREDLFISIHFDTYAGGKKLIYYAGLNSNNGLRDDSFKLASIMDKHISSNDIRSSVTSRFGRLYIDDNKCPAILIEIDRIDKADDSLEARLEFSNLVLSGLREYLGITNVGGVVDEEGFNTPFQRVFVIENNVQRQLNIERMSIVGDKLYIAIKEEV